MGKSATRENPFGERKIATDINGNKQILSPRSLREKAYYLKDVPYKNLRKLWGVGVTKKMPKSQRMNLFGR